LICQDRSVAAGAVRAVLVTRASRLFTPHHLEIGGTHGKQSLDTRVAGACDPACFSGSGGPPGERCDANRGGNGLPQPWAARAYLSAGFAVAALWLMNNDS
jgi:hypothetical protein